LIDLEMFVNRASDKDVSLAIKYESFSYFLNAYLWDEIVDHAKPDVERVMIANEMIRQGFAYLTQIKP
jgi:hypothetical protein